MRIIQVETCGECPMIEIRSCGCSYACGHSSAKVKRPYAVDRVVERGSEPPEWCPLSIAPVEQVETQCVIFGSEIDFEMTVSESELKDTAQQIWDHPSTYCQVTDGSEESYYQFLKYLWIKYPDGREDRLADVIK